MTVAGILFTGLTIAAYATLKIEARITFIRMAQATLTILVSLSISAGLKAAQPVWASKNGWGVMIIFINALSSIVVLPVMMELIKQKQE